MKIETKGIELYIDGKVYDSMTVEERKNVWLRCVDYMRTHYNTKLAAHIARCMPCYLGHLSDDKEDFSIEL